MKINYFQNNSFSGSHRNLPLLPLGVTLLVADKEYGEHKRRRCCATTVDFNKPIVQQACCLCVSKGTGKRKVYFWTSFLDCLKNHIIKTRESTKGIQENWHLIFFGLHFLKSSHLPSSLTLWIPYLLISWLFWYNYSGIIFVRMIASEYWEGLMTLRKKVFIHTNTHSTVYSSS